MKSRLLNGRQNRYYYPLPTTDNPNPSEKDTLPRMTTILNKKDKPKLREWYGRMAANQSVTVVEAAMSYVAVQVQQGVPPAEAVKSATDAGIAPKFWVETKHTRQGVPYQKEVGNATWESICKGADKTLRKAGNLGSAVHKYPELRYADEMSRKEAIETLIEMNPEAKEAISDSAHLWFDPLDAFFDDKVEQIDCAERALYNPELGYAGTTDMIVVIDGELVIIDFKTGSAGNFNDVGTQLAGYALCTEVEPLPTKVDADGAGVVWDHPMYPMPEIAYGLCVHLHGDGTVDLKRVDVHGSLKDLFVSLVGVYYADLANANDKWIDGEVITYKGKEVSAKQ